MRPHQPIRFGYADLRGRQAFVGTVIPFRDQWRYFIDGDVGQPGRVQSPLARAADHQRVIKFDFTENPPSDHGLRPPGIGQLDLGATGVPARLRPLGLPVSEQQQPVALHAHADRLCQTVAIRPAARGEGDLLAGARSRQARKFAPTARNYAVARLAADVGLRINEACMLDLNDVRWELGRFGKLNVRYGRGSRRKGPKPRLVPLINGADRSVCWFIENVLGLFGIEPSGHGTPLFPSERKNTDGQHDYGGQIVTVTYLEGVAGRGRRRGR